MHYFSGHSQSQFSLSCESLLSSQMSPHCVAERERERESVCVCVCVSEREREKERERERWEGGELMVCLLIPQPEGSLCRMCLRKCV